MESGPVALRRSGVNMSVVVLKDLFAHSQPDTRPFKILLAMQALENFKNLLGINLLEAHAIVADLQIVVGAKQGCSLRKAGSPFVLTPSNKVPDFGPCFLPFRSRRGCLPSAPRLGRNASL